MGDGPTIRLPQLKLTVTPEKLPEKEKQTIQPLQARREKISCCEMMSMAI